MEPRVAAASCRNHSDEVHRTMPPSVAEPFCGETIRGAGGLCGFVKPSRSLGTGVVDEADSLHGGEVATTDDDSHSRLCC